MKLKKIKLIFLLLFLVLGQGVRAESQEEVLESQKQSLNISEFTKEAEQYTKEAFPDLDIGEILNSAISGNIDNEQMVTGIFSLLGTEVKTAITTLGSILVIVILHSILKTISEYTENKSIGQISYYIQYILIVGLVMHNFTDIVQMTRESVQNLVGFNYTLIPLLITLLLTTGSMVSVSIMEPVLLFLITFLGNLISNVIIPIVLAATVLGIVSQLSDKVQIDKIAKFFKSSVGWILGVVLTIFVGVLSLEGTLGSTVDGLTAKTTKAAVSNFIPVVGKVLGDAVDTVLGCANILKNAVGIVGVIIIIGICILPIIKLATLTIFYHLTAALCQPIADGKIVKLLEQMGDTFKILLAIVCSVSVMLIIGITLVVRISNSGMMYR